MEQRGFARERYFVEVVRAVAAFADGNDFAIVMRVEPRRRGEGIECDVRFGIDCLHARDQGRSK